MEDVTRMLARVRGNAILARGAGRWHETWLRTLQARTHAVFTALLAEAGLVRDRLLHPSLHSVLGEGDATAARLRVKPLELCKNLHREEKM